MTQSLEVAVIGAGMSGLIAGRQLQREGHRVTIFEKSNQIGGVWVYDPRVESDALGQDPVREIVHSSIYLSLRTNLPRPLMSFSEFDFEEKNYGDPRIFPGHPEVLAFLNDFATRFGIVELIRFNSEVIRVETVDERVDKWVVEWKERIKLEEKKKEKVFDAVVVCNGHCSVPRLAQIPGIEKWPGKQAHSHNYRVPESFKDQVVVIIGNGPSAYDISRDISREAKEVHLSSRSPDAKFSTVPNYPNILQHSAVYMAKEDGTVEFKDKSSVEADIILHCTGYEYEFPFLKTNGIVKVEDNRVGPLYKHIFPPKLAPRLSFVCVPQKTIIFEMSEVQSKWIARALSGKVNLPTEEEMTEEVNQFYNQFNRPKHLTHFLTNFQEYLESVAVEAGVPAIEEWKMMAYKYLLQCIQNHDDGYRDRFNPSKFRLQTKLQY